MVEVELIFTDLLIDNHDGMCGGFEKLIKAVIHERF
tara:strand:- start:144 stop:251 length:108 start_codon:yes stop_codon:yes gene_type:complete